MNRAIWIKAIGDSWRQLLISSILMVLFAWVFVWLMSMFDTQLAESMVAAIPDFIKEAIRLPSVKLATKAGLISAVYIHVITILIFIGWAVGRSSDPIAGEIGRGTMDLILVVPIRRATMVIVPGIVTMIGSAVLAAAIPLGIWLGLMTVDLGVDVSLRQFFPGSVNLFCMAFCLGGITAFISSWNRDRWRTIILTVGFYLVSFIIKMIWRFWSDGDWVKYFTFLSGFRPQMLILEPESNGLLAPWYNLPMIGVGLLCYAAAVAVFSVRDIPAAK